MAIDYIIDYACAPKQQIGTQGILDRIKGKARAEAVISMFREQGDNRPVSDIGFEFSRSTPEGANETHVLMVQDLLNAAAELTPLEQHCLGCPANNTGQPFGCMGQIEYPISAKAEIWLMNQLPGADEPLPWLALRQALEQLQIDGASVAPMRGSGQPYFQETGTLARGLGEFTISNNQIFEMLFLLGAIKPSYAATLLMFFGAIRRDMDADEMMALSKSPDDALQRYDFYLRDDPTDDQTTRGLKRFFRALYLAWGLNVPLILDV